MFCEHALTHEKFGLKVCVKVRTLYAKYSVDKLYPDAHDFN